MSVLTREGFHALQAQAADALARSKSALTVLICAGTGCIASGSMKVYENLRNECQERGLSIYVGLTHHGEEEKSLHIKMSGCHGFCEMGCLVHIEPLGVMYVRVKPEDCHEIVERTLLGGEIIERLTYHQNGVSYPRQEDIPFYKKQHRVVLKGCGASDAEDLEEYIAREFAYAFGAAEEQAFCVGTGTGQPTGLFTTNGGTVGVTAASATAVTTDEVISLIYALKAPYRKNAKFLMNDATVSALRKLKDSNGQYLWQPSLQAGQPDRLLGYEIYTSPYAPTLAAGALSIAFGDFQSYWIADRTGRTVQRLNELYSTNGQVGFVATERVDGKIILPEGIQLLKMKAS